MIPWHESASSPGKRLPVWLIEPERNARLAIGSALVSDHVVGRIHFSARDLNSLSVGYGASCAAIANHLKLSDKIFGFTPNAEPGSLAWLSDDEFDSISRMKEAYEHPIVFNEDFLYRAGDPARPALASAYLPSPTVDPARAVPPIIETRFDEMLEPVPMQIIVALVNMLGGGRIYLDTADIRNAQAVIDAGRAEMSVMHDPAQIMIKITEESSD